MNRMRISVLAEWWFWLVVVPAFLVLVPALDRALAAYSANYWRRRGGQAPPRRYSYLDAGRFVIYAGITGVLGVVELARADFAWAAALVGATALFGCVAAYRARRNVI